MRQRSLFRQTIAANLILVVAALTGMALVTRGASISGDAALVLALAIMLTVVVNVWLLQRRFIPLEELIDEMEKASLSAPRTTEARHLDGRAGSEEVARLELAFARMLDRLESERRRSGRVAVRAQERERARVARDLHDEVNQALTGIILHLEAARSKSPPDLQEELDATRTFADQAMDELLRLARHLRPTALDDLGLKAAIAGNVEEIGGRSELATSFEATGDFADLPDEVGLVIYRVAQEALNNALQHAEATRIDVRLVREGDRIRLDVADDGAGFTFEAGDRGLGLAGMRERANLVGGGLEVLSGAGTGTTIRLRVPVSGGDSVAPPAADGTLAR